jgi:hypothetical protein
MRTRDWRFPLLACGDLHVPSLRSIAEGSRWRPALAPALHCLRSLYANQDVDFAQLCLPLPNPNRCSLPPVTLHVGDKLFIDWDEPIHFVAVYDLTTTKRLPTVPYPPQPKYKCPNCECL